MNNLSHHLSSISEKGRIIIVGNSHSFEKYRGILDNYKKYIHFHDIDKSELTFIPNIALVVVLGRNNKETHNFYSKCYKYKENHIPVVFGNDERGLTYHAPNWKTIDLTILGMFNLANQYISGLEKKRIVCRVWGV